jgi:hypothetical protein
MSLKCYSVVSIYLDWLYNSSGCRNMYACVKYSKVHSVDGFLKIKLLLNEI